MLRGPGLYEGPMRWLPLLLLACSSPVFAQAAQFDPRCGTPPAHRSYDPPAWLGDAAPTFPSAAAAEAEALALKPQLDAAPAGEAKAAMALRYADAQRERYLLDGSSHALREAVRAYALSIQEAPSGPRMDRTLFRLANLLEEQQEPIRARQVYHRLILNEPSSPLVASAYIRFGLYYLGEGDPAVALRFFEKAGELRTSERGLALYLAAWSAHDAGDGSAARAFAERALAAARGPLRIAVRADWCAFR